MFTYDRNLIIAVFRNDQPGRDDVTEEELEEIDASLKKRYDEEARKQATKNGIPINTFTLSWIVFLAGTSNAKKIVDRVKSGCKLFISAEPQP